MDDPTRRGHGCDPTGRSDPAGNDGPARWQVPEIDRPALVLARRVRLSVAALRSAPPEAAGSARWSAVLEPLAEPLEDGDIAAVGAAARRVRSAFGVGESVAEDLPREEALALRDAADEVLRAIARYEARRARRSGSS